MAEMNQFGSAQRGSAQECSRCEALLMDVLDGAATVEDQNFFDAHVASCTGCSEMLADARRGGAWLEMLRDPRPEPPAALLERILLQTSGVGFSGSAMSAAAMSVAAGASLHEMRGLSLPGTAAGQVEAQTAAGLGGAGFGASATARVMGSKVLPFPVRGSIERIGQTMLQPRLVMTAAMAFFSIALTLNLTGVHVSALRASDLRPANLRRQFYEANAHVVRYCDNLRVVYELEARTHELQRASDTEETPGTAQDDSRPGSSVDGQPGGERETPKAKATPGPGTSRREPSRREPSRLDGIAVAEMDVSATTAWPSSMDWQAAQHEKGGPA